MATNNSKLDPDTWVDNYADSLFSYAFFRVQNRSLAEELVQETFVAALVAKDKFKGNSSEKTWFFAILKNKIIDQLRRKYREKSCNRWKLPQNMLMTIFLTNGGSGWRNLESGARFHPRILNRESSW